MSEAETSAGWPKDMGHGSVAVIFVPQRTDADDEGYGAAGDEMVKLASAMPRFITLDSARFPDGLGITATIGLIKKCFDELDQSKSSTSALWLIIIRLLNNRSVRVGHVATIASSRSYSDDDYKCDEAEQKPVPFARLMVF